MTTKAEHQTGALRSPDRRQIPAQKSEPVLLRPVEEIPDSLDAWMARYQAFAIDDTRSPAIARKIALHLQRFRAFFAARYGHARISTCLLDLARSRLTNLGR
jgi:hypothetical protein